MHFSSSISRLMKSLTGGVFEKGFWNERRNLHAEFSQETITERVIGKRSKMFIKSPECAAVQVPVPASRDPSPVFSMMESYVIFEDELVHLYLMMIWISIVPSIWFKGDYQEGRRRRRLDDQVYSNTFEYIQIYFPQTITLANHLAASVITIAGLSHQNHWVITESKIE